jgi:hypothetical protein
MSIFKEFPFPLGKPEAQELVRVMTGFYSERSEALRVTQSHGIDPYTFKPNLSPIELWEVGELFPGPHSSGLEIVAVRKPAFAAPSVSKSWAAAETIMHSLGLSSNASADAR